uniref:hypothetical protein n=1 Tax=Agathobacter sp. TaxID=2021311 RepID=UPI0040563A9A
MKLLEITFDMLINAFDNFIKTEEQELGCLNNKQHSDFLAMRNYIDDVFIEKLNEGKPKAKEEKKQDIRLVYIPFLEDDDDGMDICKRKRSQEYEK